jgi:lipopolysaccharide transport system ATP-binding protein
MKEFALNRPVIKAEGIGKEYVIGGRASAHTTFYDMLGASLVAPIRRLRRLGGHVKPEERFWALKAISFEIYEGEVVGIIGRNGAGKSTLLKLLSRITSPTEGRAEIRGRVASLLEVGTGFHPELTGRENIYLNGAILGMSRVEIRRKFGDIVAFAGIDEFLDTPVKRYSSGMYVRLAFAVAAHLEPDVLLVDEVLAVGDIAFQRKCLGAMQNLAGRGRTVVLVSHNMGAIQRLCTRGIVVDGGHVSFIGETAEAISVFLSSISNLSEVVPMSGPLRHTIAVQSLRINGKLVSEPVRIRPRAEIVLDLELSLSTPVPDAKVIISILKNEQTIVALHDVAVPTDLPAGIAHFRATLPSYFLSPGDYGVSIGCFSIASGQWTWARGMGAFSIKAEAAGTYDLGNMGLVHLGDRVVRVSVGATDRTMLKTSLSSPKEVSRL